MISQSESLVSASYLVAEIITKKSKPFLMAYLLDCIELISDIMYQEKEAIFYSRLGI
jgi:hypothetical protein